MTSSPLLDVVSPEPVRVSASETDEAVSEASSVATSEVPVVPEAGFTVSERIASEDVLLKVVSTEVAPVSLEPEEGSEASEATVLSVAWPGTVSKVVFSSGKGLQSQLKLSRTYRCRLLK